MNIGWNASGLMGLLSYRLGSRGCSGFAPTICAVVLLLFAGCSSPQPLSRDEAITILNDARNHENQNDLSKAYFAFKRAEGRYESNDDVRQMARDGAQHLRIRLETQRTEVESQLANYHAANGRFPQSLMEIEKTLSPATRASLPNLRYAHESDEKVTIHDGATK
jgi:hypothetical protein